MTPADAKKAARKEAHARRDAAVSKDRQAAAARHLMSALADHTDAVVAGYLPIRSEADPRPAMHAHPGSVCVPRVVANGHPLEFVGWHSDAVLEKGAFGVMVPKDTALHAPSVLIVPMLAFDAEGYRLGYGGGFYDRTLELLRKQGPVVAIGLAFAAQQMPRVPTDATDQPLDFVVTEKGVLASGVGAS